MWLRRDPHGSAVTAVSGSGGRMRQSGSIGAENALATVLLVDDEEDLRTLLRMGLERSHRFTVVGEGATGRQGIELARELRPDVVLLDLMMPEQDGRHALPSIVTVSPSSMVVVVSALQARNEASPAIAAGAFAYIEKAELSQDVTERLTRLLIDFRRALRGETVVAPSHLHVHASTTPRAAAVALVDAALDEEPES